MQAVLQRFFNFVVKDIAEQKETKVGKKVRRYFFFFLMLNVFPMLLAMLFTDLGNQNNNPITLANAVIVVVLFLLTLCLRDDIS